MTAANITDIPQPATVPMRRWLPASLLSCLFGGTCGFFLKLSLNAGVDLYLVNLTTSAAMVAVAYVAILVRGGTLKARLGMIAIASGILGGVGQICYFGALSSGPVSIVAVLINLYPAITILLSITLLGERLSFKRFVGVALALIASILLVG